MGIFSGSGPRLADRCGRLRRARLLGNALLGNLLLGSLLLVAGCDSSDPIRSYRVPRLAGASPEPTLSPSPSPTDMLPPAAGVGNRGAASLPKLQYQTPEGWVDEGARGMRWGSWAIPADPTIAGQEPGDLSIMPAGGEIPPNLSRWLGQVNPEASPQWLEERTEVAMQQATEVTTAHGVPGRIYWLEGEAGDDPPVILAAILPMADSGMSLFVKLTTGRQLAQQQRQAFEDFVASLAW
jgi:hypothetical protein